MAEDVGRDQLAVIRIDGMHCHKCQQSIQRTLMAHPGVREVEVDFPTGQASILFDRDAVTVKQLMDSINEAGYHAVGFTQGQAGHAAH